MHDFSRHPQSQKEEKQQIKKKKKRTIFAQMTEAGGVKVISVIGHISLPSVGHVITGKSGAMLKLDSTRWLHRNHVRLKINGSESCTQAG